jgi:methylmalonyl-CoA mutase
MPLPTLDPARDFPPVDRDAWRRLVDADLNGAPFERKLVTHTYEGLYVQPLYTAADWPPAGSPPNPTGFAGFPPFTRGTYPLGLSSCGWDIRQEHAEPSPALLNAAILDNLRHGVTSILLRLDAAGRAGLDADDPHAAPLVGTDGASLSCAQDWLAAFDGVHPEMIGITLEPGAAFIPAAAHLVNLWSARGLKPEQCHGGFNADPLAVLARDGRLPMPLGRALALMADLACFTHERYPHVTAVRVGTAAYHHAGATATQDLAFSMATALEYLRAMTAAGLSVEHAARQMLFSFAVGTNFFLAAAKLRAARRLWCRVLDVCLGEPATGDATLAARRMRLHVRPSKRVFTRHDPWVNLLRNTACVFAAAVGGAEAVGSLPLDAASTTTPSDLSRRIARNTQLILQEESHLHRVADPAGGSWYLESLTESLADKAWVILQAIESRGGFAAALAESWVAEQIRDAFAPRAKNIATRRDALAGVSEFPLLSEQRPPEASLDRAAIRGSAVARLAALDHHAATPALRALAAGQPGRLASLAVDAARAGATLGQLHAALGLGAETTIPSPLTLHPFAEPFDAMRDAADDFAAAQGHRPRVFLASVGPIPKHLARTNFAQSFFEAGGFEALASDGYPDARSAADAFARSGASIAVICSSDTLYPTLVPELAPMLHHAGARRVILAGNPGDHETAYRQAGVDRFIFVKCDVVGILHDLLVEEGVHA